jgi:hypothetical protein
VESGWIRLWNRRWGVLWLAKPSAGRSSDPCCLDLSKHRNHLGILSQWVKGEVEGGVEGGAKTAFFNWSPDDADAALLRTTKGRPSKATDSRPSST